MVDGIISEITMSIMGVAGTLVALIAGIYIKKIGTILKRKMLLDEISKCVKELNGIEIFENLVMEEKIEVLTEKILIFAQENEIGISERELSLLVENELSTKSQLMRLALNIKKERYEEN